MKSQKVGDWYDPYNEQLLFLFRSEIVHISNIWHTSTWKGSLQTKRAIYLMKSPKPKLHNHIYIMPFCTWQSKRVSLLSKNFTGTCWRVEFCMRIWQLKNKFSVATWQLHKNG